ncbi:MAG: glycosyltransferase [Nitrososphaeraceae archaeon]
MRILHLSHDGLPDSRVEKCAATALSQGHEVSFGGRESKNYIGKTFSKIFTVNWTAGARMGFPFYWQSVKKQVEKVIREVRPDLVHAHNIFSAKMISEFGLPFVYDDHENWSKQSRILIEKRKRLWENLPKDTFRQLVSANLRRTKSFLLDSYLVRRWNNWENHLLESNNPIITVSDKIAEELRVIANSTDRIFVVPNFPAGWEVKDFEPPPYHAYLSSVYAGADSHSNKGIIPNRNIDGLTQLFDSHDIGNLTIIGWDEKTSSSKIRYTGLLSRQSMYGEMFRHSIGLLPWKKHWSHTFVNPNKCYEYAHAGLFVLCTSSFKTVIQTLKEENCATFDDYNMLVELLIHFKDNMEEVNKKRQKIFEFARENLIWERNENNIFRAYQICK